ncbi:LOW QUALITY PROTEIN: protein SCAR3-like [Primulina tabacum]|uniref:LOW QUALITY PROTEIN: protein SCAR3-like n=1 Tax=Primulina tabacum TaxID=48773 RepID=UPI003F592A7B
MPLVRVEVRNEYKLGAYREANMEDPRVILEGVTVTGLVGVLRQLGDLAEFAAEVFHGLQEEVGITSSRSHKLVARVQQIEVALSPLEKAVLAQRSHLHLAYTAGYNWHAHVRSEQNHFIYSDVPQFIMDSYEGCRDPPCLYLLDRFDHGGPGSCLKRYSDPTLFKRASVASGVASIVKISKDENGRNIKRRRPWLNGGKVTQRASFFYHSGRVQFAHVNAGGRSSPSLTASSYDSTLRSDLCERSNLELRNGSSFVVDDFCFSNSMQPEELESKASISSPIKSQDADFFKYNLFEPKGTDVHDDIQVSLLQEQARGSSSSLAWDDKTEILEPVAEDYVKSGITQEDDRDRNTESFSQILGVETIGGKEVNLETVYTVDVKPTNEAMRNLETCDVNLDHIESETDQFVDALNTIGLEPDDGQSEVKRNRSECETSRAESNVLAYNDMVNDSIIVHDPILFSQKSHTAAYCSINGVAANSELQSVVAVDKDVHSALRTGEPVNSSSPLKVDYIENADIDEGINVESVSSSMSSNYKDDNIDVGTSREAVPYTVSSYFFGNKSGVPSVDRPRSSPESHKPAPETSNVSPVMFWTNGGLLGLQPSKPPDCGLANVLPQYPLSSTGNSEDRLDRGSSMCQENQECGSSIRKISLKIPPVALEIKNDYVYPNNNSGLPSSLATRSDMLGNSEFQADRHQENIRDSSHKSEFRNTGMYYRKPSRGGNEIDISASYQNAGDFEQKNGENIACRIFSGRNKDLVGFGSSTLSPSASPPLEHMKMPFQPIDGFQAPRLKLKFPDGNYNSESRRIVFPSFQLVPEVSSMTHNDGSDSDDDRFYRSSPSLMDEFPCHQSESNSEKWESGESPCSKDPDLYDTFHRISLTDSIVTVPGNGRISEEDICGVLCPVENGVQNSISCHSSDLRSLDTENPSLKEYLGKNAISHDLLGPQCTLAPTTQSLPPVQWCSLNSHQNDMEDESQSMPEASKYVFNLELSASTVSQPKPAPSNQDPIMETQFIQNSQSSGLCNSNGQRDANQSNGRDEMGDFLHQLRTRSFNLRSTVKSKPAAPTGTQANVQVTAILEKASAVRQAVDSDDEEGNGTWSDP